MVGSKQRTGLWLVVALVAAGFVTAACGREAPSKGTERDDGKARQEPAGATLSADKAAPQGAEAPSPAAQGDTAMAKSADEQSRILKDETTLPFNELKLRNDAFAEVEMGVPVGKLTDADKRFLKPLIEAADVIDKLFWTQASTDGLQLKRRFEVDAAREQPNAYDELAHRFVVINAGRFDRLGEMKPFIGTAPKPAGGTFYPTDLTKDEFEKWVADHPSDKAAFTSPYTVIVRDGATLRAVPYSDFYRADLKIVAEKLREAAAYADSPSLQAFLLARAAGCETNDWAAGDAAWVDVTGSRFEVTVGPYEVYEDTLMSYKAAFEIFLTMTDTTLSEQLSTVKAHLDEMEAALPLDEKLRGYKRAPGSPIFAVDLVYSAGDTRAGVQTLAFNLPNDEDVREKKGSKKVLMRNVSDAKFEKILAPIAAAVLVEGQVPLLRKEDYFQHTLLHEIAHGMGPGKITLADGSQTTVSQALKELYPAIEEAKADTLGLLNALFLIDKGFFKEPDRLQTTLATALAGFFRSVRFGAHEAHGKANLAIYGYLAKQGAYTRDAATGRFAVDFDKARAGLTALGRELLNLEAAGDYAGAKAFLDSYAQLTPEVQQALDGLKGVPVDIRPVFTAEGPIRGPSAPVPGEAPVTGGSDAAK